MPQQDALALLDADHNKVAALFQQYKTAHDDNRKRLLAQQICQELTVHAQIEEEIFYPAFGRATGDQQLLQHSRKEHQEARELISKVENTPTDARLMLELEDAVLHHVNDEREKMFPQARKAQGLDLMQLATQLEARKSELMAPHPA
ncbi:hemerythrin domain-containing protein [Ramlibacter alkalitolerans]|jgi:hemerythrin superfamily protein|uniref:Hemerythrin domain-containing protein n=1 Tax=Ramlibacter alkalitolerans TaxID=2039631 RepID=A0ABS1JPN3_9BURK|nr:hemerythrin domain-containing protein [Ramlibacter alkalitolerans]MBL0426224.1 hemerythrin domain-containing protein [Ramlibacter alkalitolerans]